MKSDDEILIENSTEYISLKVVGKLLGRDSSKFYKARELKVINRIPNVRKINRYGQTFFSIQDISKFLENHINKSEILELLSDFPEHFIYKKIRENKIESYNLGSRKSLIYYKKSEIYSIFSENLTKINLSPIRIENEEYINIYKVAQLFGKDHKKLQYFMKSRERFASYVERIPNLRIIERDGNPLYCLEDIDNFLRNYISKKESIKKLSLSIKTFDKYIKENHIKEIYLGSTLNLKFYKFKDIKEIFNNKFYNTNLYMNIYEIAEKYFGRSSSNFIIELKEYIYKLPEGLINEKNLIGKNHKIDEGRYIFSVFLRSEVNKFFKNHKRETEVIDLLKKNAENENIVKRVIKNNKDILKFHLGKNKESIFYPNSSLETLYNEVEKENAKKEYKRNGIINVNGTAFYSQTKVRKVLNIGKKLLDKLKGKYLHIAFYEGQIPFYNSNDVNEFLDNMLSELNEIKDNYYTIEEIKGKYSGNYIDFLRNNSKKLDIDYYELPFYLKSWLKSNGGHVFKKSDVDLHWKNYRKKVSINQVSLQDPFEEFIYKVEQVLKLEFPHQQLVTKFLWYEYVKKKLIKSNSNNITVYIHSMISTTEYILNIFNNEIFKYTSKEINTKFLNPFSKVPRQQQRDFYRFIKTVVETFNTQNKTIIIKIEELNDPTKYESLTEKNNSIYSLEEYHEFYKYCNRINFHKQQAISDVKNFIGDVESKKLRPRYKKYDSTWLYVLVQLTNSWRHNTVITQIPRINLSNTRIKNLEWLEKNTPSLEEANDIIFQIGRYVQHIHKTNINTEGTFNIGEPLKIAFATAVAICELRTQLTDDSSVVLIRLSLGKNYISSRLIPNRNPYNIFFKEFRKDLIFENLKMNKTLNTLIWSVLNELGKGLKESQLARGHKNQQTTIEHYIKLNKEQINALVMQLFQRDNFGHVTQMFNNILLGKEDTRTKETKNISSITKHFGDPIKIEATSGLINKLSQERKMVIDYLSDLNNDQIWALYLNSLAGNLPSKERYYQCVYSKCKYVDEFGQMPSCLSCGAAIINVYALSQLMDSYIGILLKIANEFDELPLGEKRKVANHFHLLYQVLDDARKRFGRKVLNSFVDGGENKIKSLGKIVSSKGIKEFLTIN